MMPTPEDHARNLISVHVAAVDGGHHRSFRNCVSEFTCSSSDHNHIHLQVSKKTECSLIAVAQPASTSQVQAQTPLSSS